LSLIANINLTGNDADKPTLRDTADGYEYFSEDIGKLYRWNGSTLAWVQKAGPVSGSGGAYPTGRVALTDAATIAVDGSGGDVFDVTLGGNRTLGNPTGAVDGQKMTFRIKQDGTGSRLLTLDTKFAFGTDLTGITLSTAADAMDLIGVIYKETGDNFHVVAFVKGY